MPEGQTPDSKRFTDGAIALTFDDVLIRPAASNVLPNEADVASRVTRSRMRGNMANPMAATPIGTVATAIGVKAPTSSEPISQRTVLSVSVKSAR